MYIVPNLQCLYVMLLFLLQKNDTHHEIIQRDETCALIPLFLCFAVSDYVRNVEDCPGLEDRLSQHNSTYELQAGGREPLFPAHLTPSQIHQGIKSGKLLQGSFLASRENFLEGQVNVEGQDKMVSSAGGCRKAVL